MKKIVLAVLVAGFSLSAQAQEWENLFNGRNLKGWEKIGGAEYSVVDGTITGYTKVNTPNSFLRTKKTYSDFILEIEFKMSDKINSGIQFRSLSSKDYKNYRVHGYQCEMDPSERAWSAGIYDEARRGWLYPLTLNPAARPAFKNGQWNKVRIEALGNNIRTFLNGVPCANILDDMTAEGFIALQVHNIQQNKALEGLPISWRNIRICTKEVEKYMTPDEECAPQLNVVSNTLSEKEEAAGWKLLWDGKTPAGWHGARSDRFPDHGWSIRDGELIVNAADGKESRNGGDIITDKKYRNFVLSVNFKMTPGANSGIKYFVNPDLNKGEGSAIGCEFQILDDKLHPDAKLGVNGNRTIGSLYDLIPAPKNKKVYMGNYNSAIIVVKGNKVQHYLNYVKIIEYERNNQMWDALVDCSKYKNWPNFGNAEEGYILLQDHGNEVHFKDIKIKELD